MLMGYHSCKTSQYNKKIKKKQQRRRKNYTMFSLIL